MKPKLEFDEEYNSTYVRFRPVSEKIKDSIPVHQGNTIIVLDLNSKKKIIGIEILNP